ncbi:hypothetical protein KIPB_015892, partial [Kipferlia bialata]
VHVYKLGGEGGTEWIQHQILSEADSTQLGTSLSVYGGYLAVGAPLSQYGKGEVRVYTLSGETWAPLSVLSPASLSTDAMLGTHVSMGSTHLVAATDTTPGAVYTFEVYDAASWPVHSVTCSDSVSSLAVDADTLAVGQYLADVVEVYTYSEAVGEWGTPVSLAASDSGVWYGMGVAMDEGVLAVGAVYVASNAGAVYLYTQTG